MFAHGQAVFTHTKSNPTGAVVNTGIDTSVASIPSFFEVMTITPIVTKVSGTVGGTAILQSSIDGATWTARLGDTLTLSNVALQWKDIPHDKDRYLFYRVLTTGTGTMSATVSIKYAGKKSYQ